MSGGPRQPLSEADRARLAASRDNSTWGVCLLGAVLLAVAAALFIANLDDLAAAAAKAAIPLGLVILDLVLAWLLARGNRHIAADLRAGEKALRQEVIGRKLAADGDYRLIAGELQLQVSAAEYEAAQLGQRWELEVAPQSKVVLAARPLPAPADERLGGR